jgi:hypothetical protein
MRQDNATIAKKSAAIRNPAPGFRLIRLEPALHSAEAKLHTFWSAHEFILIRLRRRQAGPISVFQ